MENDLIAYASDKLPGEYGAVIAVLGTMSVTEPLAITDTELYAVTGTGKRAVDIFRLCYWWKW